MAKVRNVSPHPLRVPARGDVTVPPDGLLDVPDEDVERYTGQPRNWALAAGKKTAAKPEQEKE